MTDTTDPFASTGRQTSVTLKYGKGFEESWLVLRGTPVEVREDLLAALGWDRESVTDLPLAELILNAQQHVHALGTLGGKLGAIAIGKGSKSTGNLPDCNAADEAQNNPWASGKTEEPKANPNQHVYDALAAASTVDAVVRVWAENQSAFADDAELTAAYKARGKALQAAKA